MGRISKKLFEKNSRIQREQVQLIEIQKELKNILYKVNESINALKVEELDIKSKNVDALTVGLSSSNSGGYMAKTPTTNSTFAASPKKSAAEIFQSTDTKVEFVEKVNNQELDLNIFLNSILSENGVMEEDDE